MRAGCGGRRHHQLPRAVLTAQCPPHHLQLLLCPLATSASPDPGQRDCGRNQVSAERLWERIVWVGQVVIVFQPLGLIPEVHRNPPHTPSLCAPGPGRPRAQSLLCHCYSNCCLSPPHPTPPPCRQLSEENANLQEYVEKETQEKKRLSRTNEELLWKLQTGDPTSPIKLSPTSPVYRSSSSGPSSPARVSMTPR